MLVYAVNYRSCEPVPDPAPLLADPRVAGYLVGWPRAGDIGVIGERASCESSSEEVGACWLRYRCATSPGFGYLSSTVPEVTLAVAIDARGNGYGRALLRELTSAAADAGIAALSLNVERSNTPARALYLSEGWRTVCTDDDSDTLVRHLHRPRRGATNR